MKTTADTARHTIMLVDDNPHVRANLSLLLRWSGAWNVVGEAEDSATALELAAALRPDLVLLDMRLADCDGLSLLPHLLGLEPAPQVVLLTAEPSDVAREQALLLGASGYLTKLIPPDELLAQLRALI